MEIKVPKKAPGAAFFPAAMYAFSTLDYFASLWAGWGDGIKKRKRVKQQKTAKPNSYSPKAILSNPTFDQTLKLANFLVKFLAYEQKESQLAITFWRHTLMHTAEPRKLKQASSGDVYLWRLGDDEVKDHMTLQKRKANTYHLSFNVCQFVRDVRRAVFGKSGYFAEMRNDQNLQKNYEACWTEFQSRVFSLKT